MKKYLIGIVVLFGLAIAAVLVGPGFIDWNSYKDQIAQQAMALTGRAVQIDGDVSLRIVPAPELAAAQVRIANAPQGSEADMATLEQLQVQVAFWPLLKGQIQVESVSLVEPKVVLEVYADGSNNWTFGAPRSQKSATDPADPRPSQKETSQRTAQVPSTAAGARDQLRIDRVSLRNATILYRDATSGVEERLEALDADVVAESLSGPFSIQGQARLRGHDLEFETASGRWVDEGATQLSASLFLPRLQARGQFTGTVSRHAEGTSLRGKAKISGDNLAASLTEFSLTSSPVAVLAKPFRLEMEISADEERVLANDIAMTLADVEIAGEVELAYQSPRRARVILNASRLDLDALLAEADTAVASGTTASPASSRTDDDSAENPALVGESAPAAAASDGFVIPPDLEASIQVVVDAAIYRQQVLRQMLFSADVTDGRLVIGEAAALMPGGSDIALSGILSTPEAVPTFDGRLDGAADNLRGVLQWLGLDAGAIPADRLRKTTFTSRVTATPQLVTFSDLDLRMDVTRVNGGVSIAVRERPGLGIGLAIDRLDLDAYLPLESAAKPAPAAATNQPAQASGEAAAPQADATGSETVAAGNQLPDLSVLDSFDANLDLRVGSLAYQGASFRDLHLDGTLQAASMVLRSFDITDLSGASVQATGRINDLARRPSIDGRIAVQVDDPSRLEPLIGKPARDLERFGAFALDTTLQGNLDSLALDGSLSAQGGEVSATGQVNTLLSDPTYNLAVQATHPDFNGLLRVLAPDAGFRAGPGVFSLAGQLTGSADAVNLGNLKLRAGSLRADGKVAADFSAEVPQVNIDLVTGEIRTKDLKADGRGRSSGEASTRAMRATGAGGASSSPGSSAGSAHTAVNLDGVHRRWSRDSLDLSGLAKVDGEITLKSKAIVIDKLRLEQTRIEANLNGGLLSVRNFEAGVYGGRLQASGTVDGRGIAAVDMTVNATGLNAGRLVRELADSDRISGALDLTASLSSRGASEAALVRSLAGQGELGGNVTAKVKQEEQLGNLVLGILGDKVKEIRGVSDASTALFSAFAGAPAKLSGTFSVRQGLVETTDTRVDGRDASIFTAGTANLPAWLLASRSDLFRSQDADQANPYVIAEANGPLDEPNIKVGGEAFKRKKSGSSGPSSSSGSDSSSSKKVKPEDVLRGLLKDLAR